MSEPKLAAMHRYHREKRPCGEIYGGDCQTLIGPPDWRHRIDRYRREVKSHPTTEQALTAARKVATPPDVLRALGEWDEMDYGDVRAAARANPSYPGDAA